VCTTSTETLLQVNGTTAVIDLGIAMFLVVGVGIAAVWHSRTGQRGAREVLWILTIVLAASVIPWGFSIGGVFLASAVFALAACAFSLSRRAAVGA
jgi:hypothetical protein